MHCARMYVWMSMHVCVCACVCWLKVSLCGAHSILVVRLGVVTTILTPFVCECVLKGSICRCGISKQAIVNVMSAEWRPPRLRAAFADIVPKSGVSVAAYFCQPTSWSMTFFSDSFPWSSIIFSIANFISFIVSIYHSLVRLLPSPNSNVAMREEPGSDRIAKFFRYRVLGIFECPSTVCGL